VIKVEKIKCDEMIVKEKICAVIVTYYPDEKFNERVQRMASQAGAVVIVDNTPERAKNLSHGTVIFNGENRGIATALNQGVKWADENGFQWCLLMDQDSYAEPDMVDTLISVYNSYGDKDKISVIGTNYTHESLNTESPPNSCGQKLWTEKKTVFTSGSLLPVAVFQKIGDFRDEFFIDHVDDEYCLRARRNGFKVLLSCKPSMRHNLGNITKHKLLGKRILATNHSAFRRYHMTRNHVILLKEYAFREPGWLIHASYRHFVAWLAICFFEEDKLNKLKSILKGIRDGILNRNLHRKGT